MRIKLRGRSCSSACVITALLGIAICGCRDRGATASHPRLLHGMGAIHHPIATRSAEAQRFFDQGLALVYAFNFGEAVNSFRRASELDPNAPMPYWGAALAYAPNYNAWILGRERERAGFDAIQTAVGLAPTAPQPERAYIDALARDFTDAPDPDQAKLGRDYADAMRAVYRRYPDDPDAAALFAASLMNRNAWRLWSLDGQPGPDTLEIVGVLEEGLRRWPEHTGVNHFYIHTMEASAHPERALPSAHRLETLAPAAAHLVHMPSHIYLRTGDYAAAVKSNQQAIAAEDAYRREQPNLPPGAAGYAMHNVYFLAFAAMMDGEFEVAVNAADQLRPERNDAMAAMAILAPLRFARWDDILRLPPPDPNRLGLVFVWRLARGCAFAAKGLRKEAADEQSAMEQAYSRLTPGRAFGMFFNDWSTLHTLAAGELAARIAAAAGDPAGAIARWRHAVSVQDTMAFDDLPDWYYPMRESLGAALLRNRQAMEAEQVFRQDLGRNPRNPRSLFGLRAALEAQRKKEEAAFVEQSFRLAWKGRQQPRIEDF